MTQPMTKLMMSVAILGLMGCGGGGSFTTTFPDPVTPGTGGDTGGDGPDDGGVTPPSGQPTGTNGLDFGEDGQALSDVEAATITTRSAGFVTGAGPDLDEATITLDAGFLSAAPADRSGTLQIGNETVAITNGAGTLATGEAVIVTFEPDRSGTYAGALEVSIAGATGSTNTGENAFVFGFETDPDTIEQQPAGSFEYVGGFQAFGSLNDADDTSTEYEGEITITVDFIETGTADVALDGQLNGTTSADLGGSFNLSGNGFSGTLDCTAGCTSNDSSLSAGFFGPEANEVAGVIGVDITAGDDDFTGVGTFILTDPVAR